MLRVTFADTASRDAFAERFNITEKVGENQLDMNWHFLQFAKVDDTCLDYDDLESNIEHEFIVKGDPAKFAKINATVLADLGKGFYHVKTKEGTLLGDFVDSIEHSAEGMTFLVTSNPDKAEIAPSTISPTSSDAQWPRIRVASRYRPLVESFNTHEMVYQSKPELFIMDTGLNASHPEFQYSGLEIENFYTLAPYNGSFDDDVGHGTAVASLAVGKNLGISSHVKLMVIKVGGASHSATLIEIGQAIDAIVDHASKNPMVSRIVNMSWGIARSAWLDAKVQSLLDMGITVICAAGNEGISVEDISPAGLDTVMTVGSIDKYDIPSGFNNISPSDTGLVTGGGLSLDIFAPGEEVLVAHAGGYGIASGTSFSAPLVSGVAATIASLHKSPVPYDQMKTTILDTATPNALLFEDDKFTDEQNKVVYLITSDPNTNYKSNEMSMYLGVHENDQPIVADLNSVLDTSVLLKLFPDDAVTFAIEWLNPTTQANYEKFIHLDQETGILTIDKPTVELPEETKLKMVDFYTTATTSRAKLKSPLLFFFQSNPKYADTLQSDVTLALSDTNSITFYAAWGVRLK